MSEELPGSDIDRAMDMFGFLSPGSDFLRVIIVDGIPKSKARPRFRRDGKVYASDEQVAAERALGWRLKEEFPEPLEGNLAVGCIFYRPTNHRVDVDNMLKHVMDSANKIVWRDDSQVTAQLGIVELDKTRPRTVIVIGSHVSTMVRTGGVSKKEAVCAQCGVSFTSRQHRPKFCSRRCAALNRETLADEVPCAWCRTPFRRPTAAARFCSDECRIASLTTSNRKGRTPAFCSSCGKKLSKPGYKLCRDCWRHSIEHKTEGGVDDPRTFIEIAEET
jgi:Holliday junction resolvase RusA-like endonuclease